MRRFVGIILSAAGILLILLGFICIGVSVGEWMEWGVQSGIVLGFLSLPAVGCCSLTLGIYFIRGRRRPKTITALPEGTVYRSSRRLLIINSLYIAGIFLIGTFIWTLCDADGDVKSNVEAVRSAIGIVFAVVLIVILFLSLYWHRMRVELGAEALRLWRGRHVCAEYSYDDIEGTCVQSMRLTTIGGGWEVRYRSCQRLTRGITVIKVFGA